MTDASDKKYLGDMAREVVDVLGQQRSRGPFAIAKNWRTFRVNSGGWAVEVGTFREYRCTADLWFDKFTAHDKRKLYYGVSSFQPDGIRKLVALAKPHLGNHQLFHLSNVALDVDVAQLGRPLGLRRFGQPTLELYPEVDEYFYGFYVYDRVGLSTNAARRLVERICAFIYTINHALSAERASQEAEVYEGVENRRAVRMHLWRERKSHLSLLRKQKDSFVCQTCGFRFETAYGALGTDFAEAHHRVPLAKNNRKRISKIGDLITVCSNCHSMLHQMKGEAGDISELRAIVRRNKRRT
jgi:5-methylcytosine-specific restriction endonuclease McrA